MSRTAAPSYRWLLAPRTGPRPDPAVLWSLCLFLLGFPLLLVSLAAVAAIADDIGLRFGSSDRVALQQMLQGLFAVLALAPFVVATGLGMVGWVRRRQPVGLAVAVMAALTALTLAGLLGL